MFVGTLVTMPLAGGVLIPRVRVALAIAVRRPGRFGVELGSLCGDIAQLQPRHATTLLLCARGARGGSGGRSVLALDITRFGSRTTCVGASGRRDSIRPWRRR